VFLYLNLFLSLVITLLCFSTTSVISEKCYIVKLINSLGTFLLVDNDELKIFQLNFLSC